MWWRVDWCNADDKVRQRLLRLFAVSSVFIICIDFVSVKLATDTSARFRRTLILVTKHRAEHLIML